MNKREYINYVRAHLFPDSLDIQNFREWLEWPDGSCEIKHRMKRKGYNYECGFKDTLYWASFSKLHIAGKVVRGKTEEGVIIAAAGAALALAREIAEKRKSGMYL